MPEKCFPRFINSLPLPIGQDGLVYEPISKQCGLPFKIDCIGSGRTKLQVGTSYLYEVTPLDFVRLAIRDTSAKCNIFKNAITKSKIRVFFV